MLKLLLDDHEIFNNVISVHKFIFIKGSELIENFTAKEDIRNLEALVFILIHF